MLVLGIQRVHRVAIPDGVDDGESLRTTMPVCIDALTQCNLGLACLVLGVGLNELGVRPQHFDSSTPAVSAMTVKVHWPEIFFDKIIVAATSIIPRFGLPAILSGVAGNLPGRGRWRLLFNKFGSNCNSRVWMGTVRTGVLWI